MTFSALKYSRECLKEFTRVRFHIEGAINNQGPLQYKSAPDIVSSEDIDNIRTAFEEFGAKMNPQLDNTGLLEPGEGSPSSSNGHGLQLAPLPQTKFGPKHYLGKTVRHLP